MTICIASVCRVGDNPVIVFCADKLISSEFRFEHGAPKIKYIPEKCIIMEAGEATRSELVLSRELLDKINNTEVIYPVEVAELINVEIISLYYILDCSMQLIFTERK